MPDTTNRKLEFQQAERGVNCLYNTYCNQQAVRRSKKQFIAVTCHYDVVDWLDPDWVFCTETMEFSRKKEAGRPLNSKSIGASLLCGRYFGTITI